jgi:hypothetical protein
MRYGNLLDLNLFHGSAVMAMLMATSLFASIVNTAKADDAGNAAGKVLRHIVMYKFKDGLPQAQIDEVVSTFNKLPSQIEQIIGYEAGTNVSREGKSEGFTHAFVVTFANEADLDTYIKHPAHQAYVNLVKDRREKVIVFDFWADK